MDLQTANANGNRNNIDSEMTAFQKLQYDLKNTIFGVLYVLLKEQEISIYTAFVLSIIQFLQIGLFAFHKTIAAAWNASDITDVLEKIYGFFNLVFYLKDTNWNVYILFFYVGIVIVALAVLDMFYISFTHSRKKLFFTWPMIALRNILTLFTTIFFYPFLDYFVSILACVDDGRGKNVHSYFTEIECWNGIHILHTIFAILGSILFVAFSLIASLTYFEYKSNLNNPTARVSSRPNFVLNIYQAIMIIALTFLTAKQFEVILIVVILGGSLLLFLKFYYNSPYHDEVLAKLWSVLTALNLWTAFMLLCAKIMEGVIFDGVVIAWILGLPFVVFLLLTIKDHRMDLLLINVNKFQSGAEVQNQIRYILKLIQWQSTDKRAGILLDGYIEVHKQTCNKDDCPIRQKVVKNNRFTKAIMNQDETLTEKYALLIQKLYMMYFYGIKKFPQNTSLRISYAFFLLEKMHSKQQALQELGQAEQNSPSFDEQFIIYRYKKLIEDEIAESQTEGQGGLDVISEVAFQSNLRQLQANIEKSALLHLEFWSQLSEDNPDLSKLSDIGSKINFSTQYVEETWSKLLKINSNNPKSMRIYGKFLVEIINDKETGEELLEKARTITSVQTGKKITNMLTGANNDYGEATPSISVSGEQDTFGLITSCNLVAASLFGYNKTELLNRKVNVLMPQVFSKFHDSFLENYLNSGESIIIGKNKERFVFGKNKTNYIFPTYLSIRAVQSIIQGIQFIATFRSEKNFKSSAYIVTTPDGAIDAVSSSCINVLKIDIKQITHKKTNIQDFVPNIIKNRYNLFSSANNNGRSSAIFTYEFPKDSEYFLEGEETSTQIICYLNEIAFQSVKENPGLQFRFERLSEKQASSLQAEKKAKISNFQFRFDKTKPTVIGEYVEGSLTDSQSGPLENEMLAVLNKSTMEGDHSMLDAAFRDTEGLKSSQQQVEEQEIRRIDYGIGIKTLRLINGKPQEIDEDKSDDNEEEAEEQGTNGLLGSRNQSKQASQQQTKIEEENPEEGSLRDFNTTFKSRKALNVIINDKTPPGTIKNLRIIAHALCLILFLLAIFDYVIATKEFNGIQTNIDLLDQSNQRLAEIMTALSKTRDLHLLQLGVNVGDETTLKNDLKVALDNAKSLKESLEKETDSLSSAHLNLLNNPVIGLKNYDDDTLSMKGLTQAIEEVISKAFEIWSTPVAGITDSNAAYYYVTYNSLNNFYLALKESSAFYTQELVEKVSDKNGSFLPFLIASGAALFLSVIVLFPILYQVNKTREEVLSLFLDIPEKTVKGLYNKCETFISNLQVGEEDDIISEVDEEELEKRQEDSDSQEFLPRKKRKRFKNSDRSPNVFFLKYFVMAVIVEGYFLYNYISSSSLLDDINTVIVELNSTSAAEGFYSFANNAERQLFIDPTFAIINQDGETVATNNIKAMYNLDSLILQEHSINRKIHSDSYNTAFNQIIMTNPCNSLRAYVNYNDCQGFADGTVYQGMTVGLTKHFENLRTLLSCYTTLPGTCTISATTALGLMETTQAEQAETMQHLYIKETLRLLMGELKVSLNGEFDDAMTRRLILFIIFLVLIGVIYVVIWLPLMRTINNDIWRTKSMLTMIPIQIVAKIKSIRLYIKRFWNERNLVET